jgi:hypothetical protein
VVSGPALQRRVIRGWTLGDYATLNSHQSRDGTKKLVADLSLDREML